MRFSSLCVVVTLSASMVGCQIFVDPADGSGGKGTTNATSSTTGTGACKTATYVDEACNHTYCEAPLACSNIDSPMANARCGAFCAAAATQCATSPLAEERVCCKLCSAFEGGNSGNDPTALCDHVAGLEQDSCLEATLGTDPSRAARVICQLAEEVCGMQIMMSGCQNKLRGAGLDGECAAPLENASDAAACVLKASRGEPTEPCTLFLSYLLTE